MATDIGWKVACGLALDEGAFDPSVLVYWRRRLNASQRPYRIDEAVKDVARRAGVLSGRSRRALDSTVLDDAVAVIDCLPVAGLDEQERAVALLALVAGQDVEPGEKPGEWRIARAVARDRVVSTVDPESRHAHKSRSSYRDGFKAHVAVEPKTGLITANTVTAGNIPDGPVAVGLLDDEDTPVAVLADSAYGSGATRQALDDAGHSATIKPAPLRPAVPGGFDRDDFAVDHAKRTVTCPNAETVTISAKGTATFGRRCHGCPLGDRCTTNRAGRSLHVGAHDRQLVAARAAAATQDFQAGYRRWRPMVERSISWLVRDGHRRCRYRGIKRNQLGWSLRVAAVNLQRLLALGLGYDNSWTIQQAA